MKRHRHGHSRYSPESLQVLVWGLSGMKCFEQEPGCLVLLNLLFKLPHLLGLHLKTRIPGPGWWGSVD